MRKAFIASPLPDIFAVLLFVVVIFAFIILFQFAGCSAGQRYTAKAATFNDLSADLAVLNYLRSPIALDIDGKFFKPFVKNLDPNLCEVGLTIKQGTVSTQIFPVSLGNNCVIDADRTVIMQIPSAAEPGKFFVAVTFYKDGSLQGYPI